MKIMIQRMEEILAIKRFRIFHYKIKNFKVSEVQEKIKDYKIKVINIQKQINQLQEISLKGKEVLKMKRFINDERVIGKWDLVGIASNIEEAKANKFIQDDYQIKQLYLLPKGKQYWVISWTKDIIFINGRENHYQIDNDIMYLFVKGNEENEIKIAIYKKIDDKEYTIEDIKVKDNTDIDYIEDKNLVGFWQTVDFITNKNSFNPEKIQANSTNLPLSKVTFTPNGEVYINYRYNKDIKRAKYTKDYIINFCLSDTFIKIFLSKFIDNKKYLLIEWKSGDYVYGRMINGYYVLEKID